MSPCGACVVDSGCYAVLLCYQTLQFFWTVDCIVSLTVRLQISSQHAHQPQRPPRNRVLGKGLLGYLDTNSRLRFLNMSLFDISKCFVVCAVHDDDDDDDDDASFGRT